MELIQFKSGKLILEGALSRPANAGSRSAAVIAHPHPQFGGSMDNNVVYALFDAFEEFGALVLRFNFRGVGGSQGSYGNIVGETEDIIAAAEYIKSIERGKTNRLILAGYSFGGLCALYAMSRGFKPDILILVSPMVPENGVMQDKELKGLFPLKIPTLIISGARDDFFDCRSYEPMVKGSRAGCKLVVKENADHFWAGAAGEIKTEALRFLNFLPNPA